MLVFIASVLLPKYNCTKNAWLFGLSNTLLDIILKGGDNDQYKEINVKKGIKRILSMKGWYEKYFISAQL